MTVETTTYISGLNSSNPGPNDPKSEGDDHLRLIKAAILATFPNISGAITPTHTLINSLFANPVSVASAATVDIGGQTSAVVEITGTTTITSFGTNYTGAKFLRFTGVLTLTQSSALNLPGGANITTAVGDTAIATPNLALNGWNVINYQSAINNYITALNALASVPTVVSNAILTKALSPAIYSATATIAAGDLNKPISSYPSAPIVLTLPTGATAGKSITITNGSTTNGAFVTLATPSGQYFNGYTFTGQTTFFVGTGDSITFVYDGLSTWQQVSGAAQLGVGQTWQNVIGSRAAGTTYTNTTGKPITAILSQSGSSPVQLNVSINGGSAITFAFGNGWNSGMFIVPAGATYNVTIASGGGSITSWWELR
ncbi:MAG: hypothetical protein KGL39_52460 [Patescibacteria group bacterium]|nr:hypothetical protein [Patescibacteria group bacterium]